MLLEYKLFDIYYESFVHDESMSHGLDYGCDCAIGYSEQLMKGIGYWGYYLFLGAEILVKLTYMHV